MKKKKNNREEVSLPVLFEGRRRLYADYTLSLFLFCFDLFPCENLQRRLSWFRVIYYNLWTFWARQAPAGLIWHVRKTTGHRIKDNFKLFSNKFLFCLFFFLYLFFTHDIHPLPRPTLTTHTHYPRPTTFSYTQFKTTVHINFIFGGLFCIYLLSHPDIYSSYGGIFYVYAVDGVRYHEDFVI